MGRFDEIFEERYEFRLAVRDDIESIMKYIHECWKENHILSRDRELFEYEFCQGEEVHFLLAIDRKTGEIEGLDGYYRTSARTDEFDVWGSMWSVRKNHQNLPMLGIAIANQFYKQVGFRYEMGVGVNHKTATPLHEKHFKVQTGILNHFYIINPIQEYRIAVVKQHREMKPYQAIDQMKLTRLYNIEEVKNCFDFGVIKTYPQKDAWYVNHRFFHHIIYQYEIYGIGDGMKAQALVVMKRVRYQGHSAIGIMDFLGDIKVLKYVSNQLFNMFDETTEFMDFYCYGYEPEEIKQAGFWQMDEKDDNVIPSHFEPYEAKNIQYWFNSDAKENFIICKADADQDRPNMRNE